jgi:hypothetical protein
MAYIGSAPTVGFVAKLQDITSGFNGSTTTFQLALPPGGSIYYYTPGSAQQLIVSLGGVIQSPGTDYTVSGSQITFTTAPVASLTCFIVALGQSINVGTPGPATVTPSTLNLAGLGNYANDAAAASGGVAIDGIYRNGSVLQIRVT